MPKRNEQKGKTDSTNEKENENEKKE